MKKGVSPLIAVVLLIVIGIGLVAIVVPMVRQPTEKTMNEASETTSRILGCKDIKFNVNRICKGGSNWEGPGNDKIWIVVENLKSNNITNFIAKVNSNENVETSYPWLCGIRECSTEEFSSLCPGGCPYRVELGGYESIAIRLEANFFSKIPESEITTIDVIPVLLNENRLDNCNDAAKKIIVNGVLNNC